MKANLPAAEPKMLARWESEGLYGEFARRVRAGPCSFCTTDRPYANGNIHLGHGVQQDSEGLHREVEDHGRASTRPTFRAGTATACRSRSKSTTSSGKRKASMTAAEIRAECRDYAAKYVEIHRTRFQATGHLGPLGRSLPDDEPPITRR